MRTAQFIGGLVAMFISWKLFQYSYRHRDEDDRAKFYKILIGGFGFFVTGFIFIGSSLGFIPLD